MHVFQKNVVILHSETKGQSQGIMLNKRTMTHSDDLYLAVERERRKELRTFIHELKKFVGGKNHLHVAENLSQSSNDHLVIELFPLNSILSAFLNADIATTITQMCDKYGIPRRNVKQTFEGENGEIPVITINLFTDFVL